MKKIFASAFAFAALAASVTGYGRASSGARVLDVREFAETRRSAAKQLPAGLVLPSSDRDISVSSLIAADFDADGDLDVIATDTSSGSLGIVVWENDGAGRLTRKHPARPKSLGGEPGSPSLDQRQASIGATIQANPPASEAIGLNAWLALPSQPCAGPASADVPSIALATLRPRAPPALS